MIETSYTGRALDASSGSHAYQHGDTSPRTVSSIPRLDSWGAKWTAMGHATLTIVLTSSQAQALCHGHNHD